LGVYPSSARHEAVFSPMDQNLCMGLFEAVFWLGWNQQGGGFAALRPVETRLIEVVVDPRERAITCVFSDRTELPVFLVVGRTVQLQVGKFRNSDQIGEMVVGPVLPAGGPEEFVVARESLDPLPGRNRYAVRNSVDQQVLEASTRSGRGLATRLKPCTVSEDRDYAVDVYTKKGLFGRVGH